MVSVPRKSPRTLVGARSARPWLSETARKRQLTRREAPPQSLPWVKGGAHAVGGGIVLRASACQRLCRGGGAFSPSQSPPSKKKGLTGEHGSPVKSRAARGAVPHCAFAEAPRFWWGRPSPAWKAEPPVLRPVAAHLRPPAGATPAPAAGSPRPSGRGRPLFSAKKAKKCTLEPTPSVAIGPKL